MNLLQAGRYFLRSISNVHRQADKKNIFLFATPRGGSTWLMEIIASQPGMKYYDEPFNVRRANVQKAGVFTRWEQLMPGTCDTERVFQYLRDLEGARFRFMNPPPLHKNHRFFTDRIVFKVHELDHMINDIEQRGGQVLYLLRHPIPTTISRAVYPRLQAYVASPYYRDNYLSAAQHAEIARVVEKGSKLQQGMVSWCFENLVPLKYADTRGWLTITYEEILLNSRRSCQLMLDRLQLGDLDAMLAAVGEPASNIGMSDPTTRDLLRQSDEAARKLGMVKKWKAKVTPAEERQAFDIMELFELDAYCCDRLVAHDRYLHFKDTVDKLEPREPTRLAEPA